MMGRIERLQIGRRQVVVERLQPSLPGFPAARSPPSNAGQGKISKKKMQSNILIKLYLIIRSRTIRRQ
jgi:hypothetical protein